MVEEGVEEAEGGERMEVDMVVGEVDRGKVKVGKGKVKVGKDQGLTRGAREPGGRVRGVRETKNGAWFASTRWRYSDRLPFQIFAQSLHSIFKVFSVGECNHPICHICTTRMRVF